MLGDARSAGRIKKEGHVCPAELNTCPHCSRKEARVLARFIGNYDGWDPWTKETAIFSIRHKKHYWCWRWDLMAYWASLMFFLGSILFVEGSICSLFFELHTYHSEWTTSVPYAIGSVMFSVGAFLEVLLSIRSFPDEYFRDNISPSQQGLLDEEDGWDDDVQSTSSTVPRHDKQEKPWSWAASMQVDSSVLTRHWLELIGSTMIFVGAVIYNVLCFSMVYNSAPGTNMSPKLHFFLIRVPNVTGGVLFVSGSWFYWASAHHTWNPFIWYPKSTAWKVSLANYLGSWGFFLGAAVRYAFFPLPGVLVPNWLEIFIGFTIGALMFLAGSYTCIYEIANNGPD